MCTGMRKAKVKNQLFWSIWIYINKKCIELLTNQLQMTYQLSFLICVCIYRNENKLLDGIGIIQILVKS